MSGASVSLSGVAKFVARNAEEENIFTPVNSHRNKHTIYTKYVTSNRLSRRGSLKFETLKL